MKAQILIAKFHFNEKLLVSTSFQGLHVRSLAPWDMRRSDPGNEVAFSSPHTFSYIIRLISKLQTAGPAVL